MKINCLVSEDYTSKANEWFKRGKEEKDIFVKFILYYISFEVLIKLKNLDKYSLNNSIKDNLFKKIDQNIIENLKKILDTEPLMNMQNNSKPSVKLDNIQDFKNILKFINYGRNNLFHGDKGLEIERDRMIVKFGCQILEKLIESIQLYV